MSSYEIWEQRKFELVKEILPCLIDAKYIGAPEHDENIIYAAIEFSESVIRNFKQHQSNLDKTFKKAVNF